MSKVKILCIGETGLGTIYHRKHTFDGLAVALGKKFNGNESLDAIIFDGPVVPRIPRRWGKRHEQDLAALAQKEDGEKLQSLEDAVSYCRNELELFTNTFSDVEKFYFLSDTDQGNINDMKMDLLGERKTREKEVICNLEQKIDRITEQIGNEKEYIDEMRDYHQILLRDIIEGNRLDEEEKAKIVVAIVAMVGEARIREVLRIEDVSELGAKDLPGLMVAVKKSIKKLDSEVRSTEKNLGARKNAMASYLARFHPVVDSKTMDELGKQAMLEYKENIIFQVLDREKLEISTGRGDDIKVGGVNLRVAHNENMLSKVALVTDISRRVRSDKAKHVMGIEETPDISIASHHGGGWRFYRQRKERMSSETVDYVHLPTLHDQKLLEEARKKGIRNIDVNRWEKSKTGYGLSSGALIIEIDKESGKRSYEFLGLSYLQEIGGLNTEMEELLRTRRSLYSKMSRLRKRGEPTKKEEMEKDRLTGEIGNKRKELDEIIDKRYRLVKIRADAHAGSATPPDETSSRVLIRAATRYTKDRLKEERITLDILLDGGDMFHGVTVGGQGKIEDYSGLTKTEKEELREYQLFRVSKATTLKQTKKKAAKLVELCMRLDGATPTLTMRDQLPIVNKELLELPRFVLENGGYYGTVSGGHFNNMFHGEFDEADFIKNLLPKEYRKQIFVFSGVREGSGRYIVPSGIMSPKLQELVGGMDLPGRAIGGDFDIYMAHKIKGASDEVLAVMKNVIDVNWANDQRVTTGLAAAFHRHHPGAGGIGGCGKSKIIIAGPATQPTIPYVHEIGKQSSVRGTMLLYMNPGKEVYKIEIIDEEVLERKGYIERELPHMMALEDIA